MKAEKENRRRDCASSPISDQDGVLMAVIAFEVLMALNGLALWCHYAGLTGSVDVGMVCMCLWIGLTVVAFL